VIRMLSVYKYCTMGGVETGIRQRMETLGGYGIEAHGFFLRDYGGRASFNQLMDRTFFGSDENSFAECINNGNYQCISIIDTFEALKWLDNNGFKGKVIVELRSTYKHTLVQLKQMKGHAIDALLVPSKFQKENVYKYLPTKFRDNIPCLVVHNFIDLEQFCYQPTNCRNRRKIIGWVGRIDPLKNWKDFLAIAEKFVGREDVEFWMIGGGGSEEEQRASFRKELTKRSIASKLRWWPLVPNDKMPLFYSMIADSGGCVVFTSRCESFGFVILETLACRCPIVSAGVGAIPELIEQDKTGLLYPSGDLERATNLIERLLDDAPYRDRLIDHGFHMVNKRFSTGPGAANFAKAVKGVVGSNNQEDG